MTNEPRFIYSNWWHIRVDSIVAIRHRPEEKLLAIYYPSNALLLNGDEAESVYKSLCAELPLQATNKRVEARDAMAAPSQ
jgi:hypothetical protein